MAIFILNDETKKNSHGFYLLNAGGRFERFTENPVMLYNHDLEQLIGKWLNLHTEGALLKATPEFDEGDPDAMKIKGKVDRGYLRGASPGIIILRAEWRENPATKESELYVTEWELVEGSVVSVPSNAGALSLKIYDNNRHLVSDENVKCHIEGIIRLGLSGKENQTLIKDEKMEIKLTAEALVALGIKETADASAISAAVIDLKAKLTDKTAALDKLENEAEKQRQKQADDLVTLAVKEGRITADKKEAFIRLALADFDTTKSTIESIPAKQSLAAKITAPLSGSTIPAERESWTLLHWLKEDPKGLSAFKTNDPEVYEAIKQVR